MTYLRLLGILTTEMSITTPAAPESLTLAVGRVVSAGAFSALHAGERIIVLRCRPSARSARKARASLSQIAAVHLTIERGEARAILTGVDHRLPVSRSCTLGAALALAAAGVPTTVSTDHTLGEGVDPR